MQGVQRGDMYLRDTWGNPVAPMDDQTYRRLVRCRRAQWPLTSLERSLGDFNADGRVDMMIKGISSIAAGASDVMVYAPLAQRGPARGVRAVDDNYRKFVRDVAGRIANPAYFEPGWTWRKSSPSPASCLLTIAVAACTGVTSPASIPLPMKPSAVASNFPISRHPRAASSWATWHGTLKSSTGCSIPPASAPRPSRS